MRGGARPAPYRDLSHDPRLERGRPLLVLGLVLCAAAAGIGVWLSGSGSHGPGRRAAPPPGATTKPAGSARRSRGRTIRVLALPSRLPRRTIELPILMYHRIDLVKPSLPAITQRLTVDPRAFAAEMLWLKRNGFHAVTELRAFDALEHGARLPAKAVMITFDDGYRDVLGKASPILRRLGMPATAFVITGRISGPDPSFLTWGQLHLLERRGIEIGSHTVHHLELPSLGDAEALAELRDSRSVLQRRLGHPVQWLAYPAGAVDARIVELARRAGYVLAVTTRPGRTQGAADPLELHRFEVLDSTGVAGLAAMLR